MGYRHSKTELLAAAVEVAQSDGLGAVTFGRVAKHLGIADRTVVYYFPTKDALLSELVGELAGSLLAVLDVAFGDTPLPPDQLAVRAWTHLANDRADAVFRLFFEAIGLCMAGNAPYDQLVPTLIEQWAAWLSPKVQAPAARRDAEALRLMALLDGLVLLRLTRGPDAAEAAAHAAGIAPQRR